MPHYNRTFILSSIRVCHAHQNIYQRRLPHKISATFILSTSVVHNNNDNDVLIYIYVMCKTADRMMKCKMQNS